MPIFMDRHDLEHTTAADIAVAHQKDLEIQERYGVKFLTYWFDQQRGTVFCLMDAPDKATAHCVHQEAQVSSPARSSRWRCRRWKPFSGGSRIRSLRPAVPRPTWIPAAGW